VVARQRLSYFVAAALALFAIIPLVFDVRKAIAALPDAATIATARQERAAMQATSSVSESTAPDVMAFPVVTDVRAQYVSGKPCTDGFSASSNNDVAIVAVTFRGESIRRARSYGTPDLDKVVDGRGHEIDKFDLAFATDWNPLHVDAFGGPASGDPSVLCVNLMFTQPAGVFPVTVDISGQLPLQSDDSLAVVRVDHLE